jgi:hypothetical protein
MTTAATIEVLQKAAEFGLKLGFEPPNTLTVQPANRCPVEFAITLKAHKPQLLTLLRLRFCMVYSEVLEKTIFFCEDEVTKTALVEAGAEEGSIYTRAELQILVEHDRARPFLPDELLRLHQAKRTFNSRFAK